MVQVMVNLLRNSCDAVRAAARDKPAIDGRVVVTAEVSDRDGQEWFRSPSPMTATASTPMSSRGSSSPSPAPAWMPTARAWPGRRRGHRARARRLILARNRTDRPGAIFEVMLPVKAAPFAPSEPTAEEPTPA